VDRFWEAAPAKIIEARPACISTNKTAPAWRAVERFIRQAENFDPAAIRRTPPAFQREV
jgi:hypothetical protein